jgi:hypothetical protein
MGTRKLKGRIKKVKGGVETEEKERKAREEQNQTNDDATEVISNDTAQEGITDSGQNKINDVAELIENDAKQSQTIDTATEVIENDDTAAKAQIVNDIIKKVKHYLKH